jgi:hypothetical protein
VKIGYLVNQCNPEIYIAIKEPFAVKRDALSNSNHLSDQTPIAASLSFQPDWASPFSSSQTPEWAVTAALPAAVSVVPLLPLRVRDLILKITLVRLDDRRLIARALRASIQPTIQAPLAACLVGQARRALQLLARGTGMATLEGRFSAEAKKA